MDAEILRSKPWSQLPQDIKAEIAIPKGFVTDEERQCYHYIARHCVSDGQIVDAGACFGSSAYCFASGLALNPDRKRSLIHSYDRFLVTENYVGDMIKNSFRPLVSEWGDDFFDIFEYQTGKYKELIRSYRGDFLTERWNGGPIDILFIDLAKSDALHTHIAQQFYPSLRPGKSLVLHQDFYFCWLPYIHIAMQYLAHRFEIIDRFIPSATRLYLLTSAITEEEIAKIGNFSREERVSLLDAFINGETGDLRAMARVTKMCQLWHDKDRKAYDAEHETLLGEFGPGPGTNWGHQLAELNGLEFPK